MKAVIPIALGIMVVLFISGCIGTPYEETPYEKAYEDKLTEICNDGIDNDRDYFTDCEDSDCWGYAICNLPESYTDEFDNDNSHLTMEICNNGIDDEGDGYIDCIDWDCACSKNCIEICNDGIDNDRDGYTDYKDWYCDPKHC